MSRCYPFPPPGYAGKCSSHEALILSIKLQKEKEKALLAREGEKAVSDREKEVPKSSEKTKDKEHRKDRKRDRDDRKKDKKDKEERKKEKKEKRAAKKAKLNDPADIGKQNAVEKIPKDDKNVLLQPKGKLPKGNLQGSSCEFVERSSVTEEHGHPVESQNVPCSSDSTGNSGKRRRSSSSPSGIQSNGNIIRIRLSSSHKKDEPSTSGSKVLEVPHQQMREDLAKSYSQVHLCTTQVKPESSVKQKHLISGVRGSCLASTSGDTLHSVSTDVSQLKEKAIEAVSQNEVLPSHEKAQIKEQPVEEMPVKEQPIKVQPIEKLSSHERRMQKKETVYQNLFVNWVAPPMLERTLAALDENGDEDWLFGKKDEDKSAIKRVSATDDVRTGTDNVPCAVSAAMQPRARFLADSEIYALPFTVPF